MTKLAKEQKIDIILVRVAGSILNVTTVFTLARVVPANHLGAYYLAIGVLHILVSISLLGTVNFLVKRSAIAFKNINYNLLQRTILTSKHTAWIGLGLVSGFLVITSFAFSSNRLFIQIIDPWLLIIGVIILANFEHQKAINIGASNAMRVSIAESVLPNMIILPTIMLYSKFFPIAETFAFTTQITAFLVSALYLLAARKNTISSVFTEQAPFELKKEFSENYRSELTDYFLNNITAISIVWFGTLATGWFLDLGDVAVYATAHRLAASLAFLLSFANLILSPDIATLIHNKQYLKLRKKLRNTTIFVVLLSMPVLLTMFLCASELIAFLGFSDGEWALRILIFGQFINLATGPCVSFLLLSGNQHLSKRISFATLGLCVAGAFLLIPYFGLIGAALLSFSVLSFQNLVSLYFTIRIINAPN